MKTVTDWYMHLNRAGGAYFVRYLLTHKSGGAVRDITRYLIPSSERGSAPVIDEAVRTSDGVLDGGDVVIPVDNRSGYFIGSRTAPGIFDDAKAGDWRLRIITGHQEATDELTAWYGVVDVEQLTANEFGTSLFITAISYVGLMRRRAAWDGDDRHIRLRNQTVRQICQEMLDRVDDHNDIVMDYTLHADLEGSQVFPQVYDSLVTDDRQGMGGPYGGLWFLKTDGTHDWFWGITALGGNQIYVLKWSIADQNIADVSIKWGQTIPNDWLSVLPAATDATYGEQFWVLTPQFLFRVAPNYASGPAIRMVFGPKNFRSLTVSSDGVTAYVYAWGLLGAVDGWHRTTSDVGTANPPALGDIRIHPDPSGISNVVTIDGIRHILGAVRSSDGLYTMCVYTKEDPQSAPCSYRAAVIKHSDWSIQTDDPVSGQATVNFSACHYVQNGVWWGLLSTRYANTWRNDGGVWGYVVNNFGGDPTAGKPTTFGAESFGFGDLSFGPADGVGLLENEDWDGDYDQRLDVIVDAVPIRDNSGVAVLIRSYGDATRPQTSFELGMAVRVFEMDATGAFSERYRSVILNNPDPDYKNSRVRLSEPADGLGGLPDQFLMLGSIDEYDPTIDEQEYVYYVQSSLNTSPTVARIDMRDRSAFDIMSLSLLAVDQWAAFVWNDTAAAPRLVVRSSDMNYGTYTESLARASDIQIASVSQKVDGVIVTGWGGQVFKSGDTESPDANKVQIQNELVQPSFGQALADRVLARSGPRTVVYRINGPFRPHIELLDSVPVFMDFDADNKTAIVTARKVDLGSFQSSLEAVEVV